MSPLSTHSALMVNLVKLFITRKNCQKAGCSSHVGVTTLAGAKYTLCSSARDLIYCVDRKGKYNNINITLRERVLALAQISDRAWSDDGDATIACLMSLRTTSKVLIYLIKWPLFNFKGTVLQMVKNYEKHIM